MTLENRIQALKKKHSDIDQKLQEEELRPARDDLVVNRLKALKLGLKDEIERLVAGQGV